MVTVNGVVAENILLSCEVLFFHFFFGIFLILLGLFALFTRLPVPMIQQKFRPWHGTIGQSWMYGILLQIGTSLYVRGDGFNPIIFSFLLILISNMIVAHVSIRAYQRRVAGADRDRLHAFVNKSLEKNDPSHKSQTNILTSLQADVDDAPAVVMVVGAQGDDASAPHGSGSDDAQIRVAPRWMVKLHGVTMTISYLMLFGAGIMFTRRSENLKTCKPLVAVRGALDDLPIMIWEENGQQVMGGFTCEEKNMIPDGKERTTWTGAAAER